MKAEAKSFKFLTMEGKVKIPFFQRTYVWDEDNWDALLTELMGEVRSTNFLGSIILKQSRPESGKPKEVEVIDGQQRLTTLSILLKVLYDSFSEEIKQNCKGDISGILYYRKDYTSPEMELKIEHSQVDSENYEKVIRNQISIQEITEESPKILRCYKYFVEKLKDMSEEVRTKILNKILEPENKMLVVIDIDENDDEQAIFDTLNTAGVRLSTSEIIKNALFKKLILYENRKAEVINFYKDTWEKTFLSDEETMKYWEAERLTGRLKRDNIEILLHCYAVIKGFFDPDEHNLSDLSKLYKEEIKKINSKKDLEKFIKKIIEYAGIYRAKFPTFNNTTSFSFDDSIQRIFHIFDELEISTFHPFILMVFKENKQDEIKEKLLKLEKFIVKNMIAKSGEVKNYNKLCKQFIQDPKNLDTKLTQLDSSEFKNQMRNGLRRMSNKNATLLLFWIELYRRFREDKKGDVKELKYAYSLEHIMPRAWKDHWKDIPEKYKPDGTKMSKEEAEKDRDEKICWIGNMTLLRSSLNKSLQNLSFEKKMEGEGKKKGIKHYAELYITKEIVDQYDKGDKKWDENKIAARTEKLEKEIEEIWR